MIIAVIIIGIILIFLVFLTFYISDSGNGDFGGGISLGMIIAVFIFVEVSLIVNIAGNPYPTAMDVYQGKTTLEYKVVDGVKVDSVVIFKKDSIELNICK